MIQNSGLFSQVSTSAKYPLGVSFALEFFWFKRNVCPLPAEGTGSNVRKSIY